MVYPRAADADCYFLERSILRRLGEALAPGGLLVFETFTREHVDVLGRRMNSAYLLEPNELLWGAIGPHNPGSG